MATKTPQAPKPKRGVGQVIARRRRTMAEAQERRAAEREYQEKLRVRDLMVGMRHRTVEDPMHVRRAQQARHAMNVLRSDHKAFLAAVGHKDVGVNLTLANAKESLTSDSTMAYTDFSDIYVKVPLPEMSRSLKEFVIEVRGMLHHEAGHIRFTMPLPGLWEWYDGLPEDQRKDGITIGKAMIPWNTLEDQRMEAAVIRSTPRIANYFIPMMIQLLLRDKKDPRLSTEQNEIIAATTPWMLMAGRSYMPDHIRLSAKREFDLHAMQFGVSADEWFGIVSRYMSATAEETMLVAVLDAVRFLDKMKQGVSSPTGPGRNGAGKDSVSEALSESLANESEDHKQMSSAVRTDVDMNESASSPEQPDDSDGDSDEDGEGQGGQDLVQQAQAFIEKASESAEVADIMSRVASAIQAGTIASDDDPGSFTMPPYMVEQARQLSGAIVDALEAFRVEKSPMWMHRQEQGYLDALAYRTKQTGERTYHRDNVNWDNKGLGLHVSFLADRSGSMGGEMFGLSQTMWAVKQACVTLGVPSTMVLWSNPSITVRVMEHDDTPVVYKSEGGTNPRLALEDMETHVQDDGIHHLVFIFTDGGWTSVGSLDEFKRPDRTFVIIGLNCGDHIHNKDADVVIPITSIDHLRTHVQAIMTDYVAATL